MTNSREKGKRGELELAKELNKHGYNCRRSQQYAGFNGDADVVGIDGLHIEVKRVQALNIDKAYEQAINDAREGEIPIVAHRKNHKPWKVTIGLDDFIKLYKATESD